MGWVVRWDNQTKQQGPPSMLIRRFHNHYLIQLVRHQVKKLFNNLNASLYFPAIGHTVAADTVTGYQNHQQQRQRLDTLYTHTTLSIHVFLYNSVNSSLSCSALQEQEAVIWLNCNKITPLLTAIHMIRGSLGGGGGKQWSCHIFVRTLCWERGGGK